MRYNPAITIKLEVLKILPVVAFPEMVEHYAPHFAVVYSLLRAAQHDPVLQQKLQGELKLELEGSLPFWRRAAQTHSLWSLALFIGAGLAQGQTLQQVMEPLLRAVYAR